MYACTAVPDCFHCEAVAEVQPKVMAQHSGTSEHTYGTHTEGVFTAWLTDTKAAREHMMSVLQHKKN
jgi:hypothetical protein